MIRLTRIAFCRHLPFSYIARERGDTRRSFTPQLLETIPKRGYRLIGRVEAATGTTDVAVAGDRPRVLIGVTLLIAAAVLAGGSWWGWQRSHSSGTAVRLAVLPFEYIGGPTDREYLADGLAEDTIVSLGMIDPGQLILIGRTSTPAALNGTRKAVRPACSGTSKSLRVMARPQSANRAPEVHTF